MILSWFVSNCSEALIGALSLWYLIKPEIRFDNTHHVGVFILVALIGPFLSSFSRRCFVMLNQFGNSHYWTVFRMRFFSNVLAPLILVPLILTWWRAGIPSLKHISWKLYVEIASLATGLLIVGIVTQKADPNYHPPFFIYHYRFCCGRLSDSVQRDRVQSFYWLASSRFGPR